jgi:hypothetical protein
MGYFSSDRTIKEYAEQIWGVQPCRRPGPMSVPLERLSEQGIVGKEVRTPPLPLYSVTCVCP